MAKQMTTVEFIEAAVKIHGNKFDYSNVVYVRSKAPVEIGCRTHGMFSQTPNHHLRGTTGCRDCGFAKSASSHTYTRQMFLERAIAIFGNRYDYSKVIYKHNAEKVEIVCRKHGPFWIVPHDHLGKHGCAKCQSSRGELEIMRWLDNNHQVYVHQMKFDDCIGPTGWPLIFDFYIPNSNLLVEFDGEQHFRIGKFMKHTTTPKDLERTQQYDEIKNGYARNKGIEMVRIPYRNMDKIPNIMETAVSISV